MTDSVQKYVTQCHIIMDVEFFQVCICHILAVEKIIIMKSKYDESKELILP